MRPQLLPDLADEDVDRAITVCHPVTPDLLVDLFPRENLPHCPGEQPEKLELAAREVETLLADVGLEA